MIQGNGEDAGAVSGGGGNICSNGCWNDTEIPSAVIGLMEDYINSIADDMFTPTYSLYEQSGNIYEFKVDGDSWYYDTQSRHLSVPVNVENWYFDESGVVIGHSEGGVCDGTCPNL